MFCHLRFLSLRVEVSGDNTLPGESDVYFLSFWCCCCWASIFLSSSFTFFWRSFTSFCTLSTFFSTSSWATCTFFFRSSTFFFRSSCPASTFFLTSCLLTSTFFWRSVTSFLARCFLASTFFFTSCRTWPWSGSSPPHPATNATSTRCVLSGSCPQFLDVTLRASQPPVDHQGVGVGADLGCDPCGQPHQGGRQRLAEAKYPLQARDGDLYSLPEPTPPLGWFGAQEDAYLGQSLPQFLAPVGQVPQEFASYPLSQSRLVDELLGQADVGYVCGGELVGERNPIGGTDEVQLHSIDAEGTPANPR